MTAPVSKPPIDMPWFAKFGSAGAPFSAQTAVSVAVLVVTLTISVEWARCL